jgi:hypothetical protein
MFRPSTTKTYQSRAEEQLLTAKHFHGRANSHVAPIISMQASPFPIGYESSIGAVVQVGVKGHRKELTNKNNKKASARERKKLSPPGE